MTTANRPHKALRLRYSGDDPLLQELFEALLEQSPDVTLTDEGTLLKSSARSWTSFASPSSPSMPSLPASPPLVRELGPGNRDTIVSSGDSAEAELAEAELAEAEVAYRFFHWLHGLVPLWADHKLKEIPLWAFSGPSAILKDSPNPEASGLESVRGIQGSRPSPLGGGPAYQDSAEARSARQTMPVPWQVLPGAEQVLVPLVFSLPGYPGLHLCEAYEKVAQTVTLLKKKIPALAEVITLGNFHTLVRDTLQSSSLSLGCRFEDSVLFPRKDVYLWNSSERLASLIHHAGSHSSGHRSRATPEETVSVAFIKTWTASLAGGRQSPRELAHSLTTTGGPLSDGLLRRAWAGLDDERTQFSRGLVAPPFSPRLQIEIGSLEQACLKRLLEFLNTIPKQLEKLSYKLSPAAKAGLADRYRQVWTLFEKHFSQEWPGERWSKDNLSISHFTTMTFEVVSAYLRANPVLMALWCGLFMVQVRDNELWVSLSPAVMDLCFHDKVYGSHARGLVNLSPSVQRKSQRTWSSPADLASEELLLQQLSKHGKTLDKEALIRMLT